MSAVSDFGIVVGFESDALVLRVVGELDAYTAPTLRDCALGRIHAGTGDVVIDLSETSFIDSSGLSVLIATRKRVQAQGGSLRLRGPSAQARKLLQLTGVADIFAVDQPPLAEA